MAVWGKTEQQMFISGTGIPKHKLAKSEGGVGGVFHNDDNEDDKNTTLAGRPSLQPRRINVTKGAKTGRLLFVHKDSEVWVTESRIAVDTGAYEQAHCAVWLAEISLVSDCAVNYKVRYFFARISLSEAAHEGDLGLFIAKSK